MKKILLGWLAVLIISPTLLFARHGDGIEVEMHQSMHQATASWGSATSTGTKEPRPSVGKANFQDLSRTGWTASGHTYTGALIEANLKALHADIAKLTPEQKVELTAMIRTYLTSKGITPTVPTMNDDVKKATKEAVKTRQEVLKEKRKALQAEMKAKREALKEARKANHNTARSNKSN